jgi:hypothetical protein
MARPWLIARAVIARAARGVAVAVAVVAVGVDVIARRVPSA